MSAQALANAVSMDEAFFKEVIMKLYHFAQQQGDDARTAMAKKLMAEWGDTAYDENALQFVMLSPTHAKYVEEQLKIEKIGYMTFNDNYGNKCFIVGEDDKERMNELIMSTIGLDPKYNKELTADKFLDYAHDKKEPNIITIKFDNMADMVDFKNKCYANKQGFVVSDYKDKDGKYTVMALASDLKTNKAGVDFISALASKSISDAERGKKGDNDSISKDKKNLSTLKDAAIEYDIEIQRNALNKITKGENFVIGNERSNNGTYIEYNAEKNNITIYDYNETAHSYGVSQEYDLSELDMTSQKDREAMKVTLSKYFDAVENAVIYTPQDFTEHLQKDNRELENQFINNRFKEFDKIFNTLEIDEDEKGCLHSKNWKAKEIADLCEGRPSYSLKMLEMYQKNLEEKKQDIYETFDIDEADQLMFKNGSALQILDIINTQGCTVLDNIRVNHPDLYEKLENNPKLYEELNNNTATPLSNELMQLLRSGNDKSLMNEVRGFNARLELINIISIEQGSLGKAIEYTKSMEQVEADIRKELHEALEYAVTPAEIEDEINKLVEKYEKGTSEEDKKKCTVFRQVKTNIEKTDVRRYDDVEAELTQVQEQEKGKEHEME